MAQQIVRFWVFSLRGVRSRRVGLESDVCSCSSSQPANVIFAGQNVWVDTAMCVPVFALVGIGLDFSYGEVS